MPMPLPGGSGPERHADKGHLPRLTENFYQGDAVVFWTLTIAGRAKGWLTPDFHSSFRETLLHTSVRQGLVCPAYVLMQDHMHFIWMGVRPSSDQRVAMAFLRTHLSRKLGEVRFQKQPHDRVLRGEDRKRGAFAGTCWYLMMNPVRAGLVKQPSDWPYLGSLVPGYPDFDPFEKEFWPKFWKVYVKLREGGSAFGGD